MKNSIDENLVNQASTSLVAVLGSGGHTTEMLKLVGALSSRDYNPRTFVYTNTDDMSPEKLKNLTNTNFQVSTNYIVIIDHIKLVHLVLDYDSKYSTADISIFRHLEFPEHEKLDKVGLLHFSSLFMPFYAAYQSYGGQDQNLFW